MIVREVMLRLWKIRHGHALGFIPDNHGRVLYCGECGAAFRLKG